MKKVCKEEGKQKCVFLKRCNQVYEGFSGDSVKEGRVSEG